MPSKLLARIVLVALIAIPLAGCSLAFVNGPPAAHAALPYFTCTQSNAIPLVDGVFGGLNAMLAVSELSSETPVEYYEGDPGTLGLIRLGWAGLLGYSAWSGFGKTRQCRDATTQLQLRLARPPGAPAPSGGVAPLGVSSRYLTSPGLFHPWGPPPHFLEPPRWLLPEPTRTGAAR